jgi:hypothetical protein
MLTNKNSETFSKVVSAKVSLDFFLKLTDFFKSTSDAVLVAPVESDSLRN